MTQHALYTVIQPRNGFVMAEEILQAGQFTYGSAQILTKQNNETPEREVGGSKPTAAVLCP